MPLCDAGPTIVDPTRAELAALAEVVDFSGLRVLEIGCGNGRLTWRYAGSTAEVFGIDPDGDAIASPVERDLPRRHFDLAFFSWSL